MTDIPELPHHPQKTSGLPRWLEWTTAISALIISVCSIGIAIYNARIESRLLKANSYPYLVAGISDGGVPGLSRPTERDGPAPKRPRPPAPP